MSVALADIATRGGLTPLRRGLAPCPVCGAERRGHQDRRPPVSTYLKAGEEWWHCKAAGCGAGGGVAALLAAIRYRQIPPKGDPRWAAVMAELDGRATSRPSWSRSPRPRPPAAPILDGRPYPPVSDVLALWNASCRLDALPDVDEVVRYLTRRGLDPRRCGVLDLSRAMAPREAWPRWIPFVGMAPVAWARTYRIVTPMIDATGAIRSLRFRAVGDVPAGKKALNPNGYGYSGLVMADPLGIALLRGDTSDEGITWDGRIIVVEGEPDFWTWSCHPRRFGQPSTWAVLGVVSGSWSEALAARIPDRAHVILRTHHDDPGEKYAERIRATLAGRCDVVRSTPPSPPHAESALQKAP